MRHTWSELEIGFFKIVPGFFIVMTLIGPIQDQKKKELEHLNVKIKNKVYFCIQFYAIFTLFSNISKIKNTKCRFFPIIFKQMLLQST